jgi:hypothetical protein
VISSSLCIGLLSTIIDMFYAIILCYNLYPIFDPFWTPFWTPPNDPRGPRTPPSPRFGPPPEKRHLLDLHPKSWHFTTPKISGNTRITQTRTIGPDFMESPIFWVFGPISTESRQDLGVPGVPPYPPHFWPFLDPFLDPLFDPFLDPFLTPF